MSPNPPVRGEEAVVTIDIPNDRDEPQTISLTSHLNNAALFRSASHGGSPRPRRIAFSTVATSVVNPLQIVWPNLVLPPRSVTRVQYAIICRNSPDTHLNPWASVSGAFIDTESMSVTPVSRPHAVKTNPIILAILIGSAVLLGALQWPTFKLLKRFPLGFSIMFAVFAVVLTALFVLSVWADYKAPKFKETNCRVTDAALVEQGSVRRGSDWVTQFSVLFAVDVTDRNRVIPAVSGDDEPTRALMYYDRARERAARFQPGRNYKCWYHFDDFSREVVMQKGEEDTRAMTWILGSVLLALALPGLLARRRLQ